MNDDIQKLKIPAIGLIITGSLNAVVGAFILLSGIFRIMQAYGIISTKNNVIEELPVNQAEKLGYLISTFAGYGIAFLSLILAPLIIYGAIQMMNGKKYKTAKRSAILAMIPLTSCCFLAGIPLGVWAIVILNRPETAAAFDENGRPRNNFPPPPNFYGKT